MAEIKKSFNILFLSLSKINDINDRGIYADLIREFIKNNHHCTVLSPFERRDRQDAKVLNQNGLRLVRVKTLNIQKANIVEKGIGTLLIEKQYKDAIKKHCTDIKYDLVLYATPPITLYNVIKFVKNRDGAMSYLLLKDIFPQNAVDMNMMKKGGLVHRYFRQKEVKLYKISDYIGCMSPANERYLIEHNKYLDASKIEINPNTIAPKVRKVKANIKDQYGISEHAIIFLYGGNLGKPQGLEFLLKILKENKTNQRVYYIIAGNGTESNKVKQFIIDNEINNSLFLERLSKLEYDKLISGCDVGLIFLDSRFTIPNFPSRLLSYLENKMPIICATDVATDIGEIVQKNNAGFAVKSGDLDKYMEAQESYVQNPQSIVLQGENAEKLLLDNYTVNLSYKKIIDKLCIKDI